MTAAKTKAEILLLPNPFADLFCYQTLLFEATVLLKFCGALV